MRPVIGRQVAGIHPIMKQERPRPPVGMALYLLRVPAETAIETNHQERPLAWRLEECADSVEILQCSCQRFFEKYMLSGTQRPQAEIRMAVVARGDNDSINFRVAQDILE